MNMIQLQEKFISELLRGIKEEWTQIYIHYEHFPWKGEVLEKYQSEMVCNGVRKYLDVSLDAVDVLVELNKLIPDGQSEPWTWVDFEMDGTGRYKFDYKYGVPPMASESLKYYE